jgi:hypothetical protein
MIQEMSSWMTLLLIPLGVLFYIVQQAMSKSPRPRSPRPRCPEGSGVYPECLFVVRVADDELSIQAPDGVATRIAVRELREIVVETNDSGPGGADVWWRLFAAEGRAAGTYPGGATGEAAALQTFQTLPGFDNAALIEAMGSTSNRRFVVYRAQ